MKKILILQILILSIILSGCSSDTQVITSLNTEQEKIVENLEKSEDIKSEEKNNYIKIENIKENDTINSPVVIKGKTSSDMQSVVVELRNSNHEALIEESVKVYPGENNVGVFMVTIHFQFNSTKEGFIAVYNDNTNLQEVPVKYTIN